ncbi:MAG: 3-oxoadipate enol-lactonase [Alphaproteobacteria bacterium]|jgi:3-oxoadipate enol-lactonase|nr:3-oxoadipate enol-lactonase [Alphaproteobacteria bacterium]
MKAHINGFDLAYRLDGPAGAPVVTFCHSLAAGSEMWDEQMPALKNKRVLRLDMRGHGASSAPQGPYTLQQLASDVVGIWDHLKIERCDFVGLSIGGMIGQVLGFAHGNRLNSLMLCDTRCRSDASQAGIWDERIALVRKAGSLAPVIESTIPRWFSEDFVAHAPIRIEEVRNMLRCCSVEGYAGCGRAISVFDFTSELAKIKARTMIVVGSDDASTTVADAEALQHGIAGSQLRVIEKCRHLPNIEDPKNFNAIMSDWLQ